MWSMFPTCSYLRYGLLAARAEILKFDEESGNPCILAGYNGVYKFTSSNPSCFSFDFFCSISFSKSSLSQKFLMWLPLKRMLFISARFVFDLKNQLIICLCSPFWSICIISGKWSFLNMPIAYGLDMWHFPYASGLYGLCHEVLWTAYFFAKE